MFRTRRRVHQMQAAQGRQQQPQPHAQVELFRTMRTALQNPYSGPCTCRNPSRWSAAARTETRRERRLQVVVSCSSPRSLRSLHSTCCRCHPSPARAPSPSPSPCCWRCRCRVSAPAGARPHWRPADGATDREAIDEQTQTTEARYAGDSQRAGYDTSTTERVRATARRLSAGGGVAAAASVLRCAAALT